MSFELRHLNNWSWYCVPELESKGIDNGFFTKKSPSHILREPDRTVFLETFYCGTSLLWTRNTAMKSISLKKVRGPSR
jgi:hypothetical protein